MITISESGHNVLTVATGFNLEEELELTINNIEKDNTVYLTKDEVIQLIVHLQNVYMKYISK